jgi:hypothetical protein
MTVVIAKTFGERIVTFSDIMLGDRNDGNDSIPGVLKSVVIALNI